MRHSGARRTARSGGEPTFAEAMANGEVALKAPLDGSTLNASSPTLGALALVTQWPRWHAFGTSPQSLAREYVARIPSLDVPTLAASVYRLCCGPRPYSSRS
jgi:hypothetical protein